MKKLICAAVWALMVCMSVQGLAFSEEKPLALYFFENYCETCHPEEEFVGEFEELTGQSLGEYRYKYGNVKNARDRAEYERVIGEYGIPKEQQWLPMAIIDGQVYAGNSKISEALPRAFVEAGGETESLMYYVFSPACESCANVEGELGKLGDSVLVKRGEYTFSSKITVEKINIFENLSAAEALFEKYDVPEEKRITPIVFMGDRYYAGQDSIYVALTLNLQKGAAIGTPVLAPSDSSGEDSAGALTWAGTAVAGLVAGFNPCALSMLLFFLALLVGMGKRAKLYAALFLSAKFVAYLLLGTIMVGVFSALNPTWMPLAAKIILTVLCVVLAALNLRDAWAAQKERYGEIKNQLPTPMRRFLNDRIQRTIQEGGAKLAPAVILLGLIVAGGEFMCSGQLYLATLTASIQSGVQLGRMFLMLVLFCAMFILPSIVLSVLVIRGREVFDLGEWARAKMPVIKVVTALMLIAVCVYAWVV